MCSQYQIIDNWNKFDRNKKEEIAKKLFFHNIINDDIPDKVDFTWNNTNKNEIELAKNAIEENSFTDFWIFLDKEDNNKIILEIRTCADFLTEQNNTIVTKRLIYTSHICIYQMQTHIQSEINIAFLA